MGVVITGMHRSGTSMLGQWVHRAGVGLGDGPLFDTDPANPRGLYERRDVVAFNDCWLGDLGGSWWAPPFITEQTWRTLDAHRLERDRGELDVFAGGATDWFVKDPRLSLLLPLWDRLCLARLPVVVAVRPPRQVAMSLQVRNGMTLRRALALWVGYNRALFKHTTERDVLVLDVGRTLAEPDASRRVLVDFLAGCGLSARVDDGADQQVEPKLLRQNADRLPGYSERLAADLDPMFEALSAAHGVPTRALENPVEVPDWAEEALTEISGEWALRQELAGRAESSASPPRSFLQRLFTRN